MRPAFASLVAATMTLAARAPAAAADLSGFLGGIETRCHGSKRFLQYRDSLGEKYTTSGDPARPVLVPDGYEISIDFKLDQAQ